LKKIPALTILLVATVVLASLAVTPNVAAEPLHGALSIGFDDAMQSQFDYAWPLMQERGIVGTFYTVSSFIRDFSGDYDRMGLDELHTLQDAGNEIGSHSVTHEHFETMTDEEIIYQCSVSQQVLRANGFSANNFAFPYGDTNDPNADHIDSIVSQYYRSARSAYSYPEILSFPIEMFRLPGFPAETGDSSVLSRAKSAVDQAYDENGWVQIYFHNVIPGVYNDPYTISSQDFEAFLDYVVAKGIPTYTVNGALDGGIAPLSALISPTSARLEVGGSKTFVSSVSGGVPPYSYRWYLNGSFSGATSPTWTFSPGQAGHYNVYAKVTDSLGTVDNSNIVTDILVYGALAASISPSSVNLTVGNTQQFTSTITGGLAPYTYQWYYANNTAITGATASILSYKANLTGTNNIYLNVTDNLSYKAKSNSATINVYSQPSVTINPASANITVGGTQQFNSNSAGGLVPYTYQWYYANNTAISGATTSSLTYKANFTGTYSIYLNVTDSLNFRVKSNNATLNVYSQPTVTINPASANIIIGSTQQFTSITNGGLVPYAYQWYYSNGTAIAGATTSTLNYKANFTGTYNIYLNATDILNYIAKSNVATLNVYPQPTVTISPTSLNMTIGNTQQFASIETGGLVPYSYQWYYSNNTAITGATGPTLNYKANFTGTYNIYLNVTDSLNYRVKSNTATLNVYSQPTALITPTTSILYYGQSQTFNASTSGGVAPYTYQWYINNTAVPQATYPDWTFTPRANGNYRIHLNVTDSLGSEVKSNIASDINVYSVYIILDPQASYSSGEQVSLKVTVLNLQNPKLETSLALTITGPAGYSLYDFQPINISANAANEFSFTWVVPNADGAYTIEASVVPTQLTAYDVKCVEARVGSTGFKDSSTNSLIVSRSLVNGIFVIFALFGSQISSAVFYVPLMLRQKSKILWKFYNIRPLSAINVFLVSGVVTQKKFFGV
jgi:peptidoglycan/xylan/chitin deacetylase (PgdA/CDA1 family)